MVRRFRIGTRGSPLALIQTELVKKALLAQRPDLADRLEIVIVKTSGDLIQDRPLAEVGGKGLFAKEIEEGLAAESLDFAVHSVKDMETKLPAGLVLAATLPREDARDVLIAPGVDSIAALALHATIGTSSLRRQAQLLALRPDLRIVMLRGNVETRLRKIVDGAASATLLALAGLRRLGRLEPSATPLTHEEMLPAVGQGAVGIECRSDDDDVLRLLQLIDDRATSAAIAAERAMLAALDGSCRTPIAGYASLVGEQLILTGLIARADGTGLVRARREGPANASIDIGRALGDELRGRAVPGVLASG